MYDSVHNYSLRSTYLSKKDDFCSVVPYLAQLENAHFTDLKMF